MYFKPYGSTVNLKPLFDNSSCLSPSTCYWLLPDKRDRLHYPYNEIRPSNYSISPEGVLTIFNIQPRDNGIYHFFMLKNGEQKISKALLNVHGAPFDSTWQEYWPNVVGGLVAMTAVFITAGLIALADKYRYRPPPNPAHCSRTMRPGTVVPLNETNNIVRENPAFSNDDNNDITNANQDFHTSRCPSTSSNGDHSKTRF